MHTNLPDSKKIIVNGNGAVAWAALSAGVKYFSHYPGSPVNQVEPILKKLNAQFNAGITFNDALNEHVATLAAAGASYCGARSLVVMKHVGLNIAADPINYIGTTGVKGGMVIVVGTDPGANSSTGEEDPHWYVPQVSFPLFEPKNISDIQKYTVEAFEISEKYDVPVFIFIPGRIAYNSDFIDVPEKFNIPSRELVFVKDPSKYINVGEKAVINHRKLLERISRLASECHRGETFYNSEARMGIVTRGVCFGHAFEAIQKLGIEDKVHLLNLDLVYPMNRNFLLQFAKNKSEIFIIEDQDGFLENQIKMNFYNDLDCAIHGKDVFPAYGEIDFSRVHGVLANRFDIPIESKKVNFNSNNVAERLGTFCEGCPHRSSFYVINDVIKGTNTVIGGDIGCSSLPPQKADWLLCMNAGIGISQGMSHILKNQKVISTGGEGSFFHAGITSLQSAVINKIDLLHLVFDNRSIAMTGHQVSPTVDAKLDPMKLLESIGVDRFFEVDAFDPISFGNRLKMELNTKGVRVLWVKGDCALQPSPETRIKRKTKFIKIENEKCGGCTKCYSELGCPAINVIDTKTGALKIDLDRCMRCGVCIEICPNDAIAVKYEKAPTV